MILFNQNTKQRMDGGMCCAYLVNALKIKRKIKKREEVHYLTEYVLCIKHKISKREKLESRSESIKNH